MQPFGNTYLSKFEEEEYGDVSALFSNQTQIFLVILDGPLQVEHLIGAIGVLLLVFI